MSIEARSVNILRILKDHLPGGDNWPLTKDSKVSTDHKYLVTWLNEDRLETRYFDTLREAYDDLQESVYHWRTQHYEPLAVYNLDSGEELTISKNVELSIYMEDRGEFVSVVIDED